MVVVAGGTMALYLIESRSGIDRTFFKTQHTMTSTQGRKPVKGESKSVAVVCCWCSREMGSDSRKPYFFSNSICL